MQGSTEAYKELGDCFTVFSPRDRFATRRSRRKASTINALTIVTASAQGRVAPLAGRPNARVTVGLTSDIRSVPFISKSMSTLKI